MRKIAFCCIALFILQIDCFCREGNLNIRLGVSSFKHIFSRKFVVDGEEASDVILRESRKPRFELGAGYSFNRLELGVYGSQTHIIDPVDQNFGLYSLGVNSKYHFSKLFIKNKISDIIDVYAAGKFEGCFYYGGKYSYHIKPGLNYSMGLGVMIFPIKVLGIYCDYGYIWNNPVRVVLNQDFLQLGICVKF